MKVPTMPIIVALLVGIVLFIGYSQQKPTPVVEEKIDWAKNFNTSLHYTRQGKITFYSAENGGVELITGKSIRVFDCVKCHPTTKANGQPISTETYTPDCYDCHVTPGDKVNDSRCLECHARQRTEILVLNLPDVHRGIRCMDCHSKEDVMGDGKHYSTLLERETMVSCLKCHEYNGSAVHNLHGKVYCTSCHQTTVIACYNCHLDSAEEHRKRAFRPIAGFQILLNYKDKVYPANFMTAVYHNRTFVTIQPFHSHSIMREAKKCDDCHGNEILKKYLETGRIIMTTWNESNKSLTTIKGVVPLPQDWRTALKFDYITYIGDPSNPVRPEPHNWTLIGNHSEVMQLFLAKPLTEEQIKKLQKEFGKR
ncbi:MAG: cytochrome c3 family protein [Archaeoglobaceae archaeon]|nr:cytochrome c3 family protein [Archaeoglobaceae archaeon]